jgi:hypothetical protein
LDTVHGIEGGGLVDCDAVTDKLLWDAGSGRFDCGTNIGEVRSFSDTTVDSLANNNTTEYWDPTTRPNITLLDSVNDAVMLMVTVVFDSTGSSQQDFAVSIWRNTNATDPTCGTTDSDDSQVATYLTNSSAGSSSQPTIGVIFIDDPGVSTEVRYTVCSNSNSSTGGEVERIDVTLSEVGVAADLAEIYPTNDSDLSFGDVVSIESTIPTLVTKSTAAYDSKALGVVSSRPAKVIGSKGTAGTNGVPVALTGRVPVKVTTLTGDIEPGDHIVSSYLSGYGMKAVKSGTAIGKAMQGTSSWSESSCPTFDSIDIKEWPQDSGDNSAAPCFKVLTENVPEAPITYTDPYVYVGKIMMYVELGQQTPETFTSGIEGLDISLGTESASLYFLKDSYGNTLENEGAFSSLKAANAEVGALSAERINTSLIDLGEIGISATGSAPLSFVNSQSQEIFSIDNFGNATISGTLTTVGGNYDLAEDYPTRDNSLVAGDLLSIDPAESGFVKKSSGEFDQNVLGIFSESPGFRLSQNSETINGARAVPVALVGRVPVKVSKDSDPIEAGDYLTASSEPGRAMKATRAGQMIGKALESWTPGSGSDRVLVYVTATYADPNNTLSKLMVNEDGSLNISGLKSSLITIDPSIKIAAKETNGSLDTALIAIDESLSSVNERIATLENDVLSLAAVTESIDTRLSILESKDASVSSQISQTLDLATQAVTQVGSIGDKVASTTASIESLSRDIDKILAGLNGSSSKDSKLTSTDGLLATTSATFASKVFSDSSVYEHLSTYDLTVENISVNGSLSITEDSINRESASGLDDIATSEGILYLQNSPLAIGIDLFNGSVRIDKDGNIETIGSIRVGGDLALEGGITITATADDSIMAGDALYVSGPSEVKRADYADSTRSDVIGIAANHAARGQQVTIVIGGRARGFVDLEAGKTYYLGLEGAITPVVPSDGFKAIPLGVSLSRTELIIQVAPGPVSDTRVSDVEPSY